MPAFRTCINSVENKCNLDHRKYNFGKVHVPPDVTSVLSGASPGVKKLRVTHSPQRALGPPASGIPWFRVQGDYVYPDRGHPDGNRGHPDGSSGNPWYSMR